MHAKVGRERSKVDVLTLPRATSLDPARIGGQLQSGIELCDAR